VEKIGFTNLFWYYILMLEMPIESYLTFLMGRECHQYVLSEACPLISERLQ